MYETINAENVVMYAIRHYNNPHCEGEKEFEDDLKRFKYIKRLLRKYHDTNILKERLLLNHLIVLNNVFGAEASTTLLLYKIQKEYWSTLKSFLIFLNTITEEELDEALDVKWDSNKRGWFDRQGRRRYLGVMATNKLMAKALDKAKKTGDFINPYKLKHGQKPEETELEEAFSKKDFQKLEQSNDHTEAAKKLIDMFGTSDEKKEMNDIKARHEKTGYISGKDYSRRIQLTNRYYSRLK